MGEEETGGLHINIKITFWWGGWECYLENGQFFFLIFTKNWRKWRKSKKNGIQNEVWDELWIDACTDGQWTHSFGRCSTIGRFVFWSCKVFLLVADIIIDVDKQKCMFQSHGDLWNIHTVHVLHECWLWTWFWTVTDTLNM